MPLYEYECPVCRERAEEWRTVDRRDEGPGCLHDVAVPMRRIAVQPILITTRPYHLAEGNRFRGSDKEFVDFQRKNDKNWETKKDRDMSRATEEAQRRGSEVVKIKPEKSLAQTAREAGVPLNG